MIDRRAGQVDPAVAAVEDGAVGGRDGLGRDAQEGVGVEDQFDAPVPAAFSGGFEDQGLEAAAVRDRAVEVPAGRAGAEGGQDTSS